MKFLNKKFELWTFKKLPNRLSCSVLNEYVFNKFSYDVYFNNYFPWEYVVVTMLEKMAF